MNNIPHVVYHVACMGGNYWKEVIREQFQLLKQSGLADALASIDDKVNITHLGPNGSLEQVISEASLHGVPVRIIRTSENTDHYETFAMIEIERLAKEVKTDRPILYMHTKGVSTPGEYTKVLWRRAMGRYVVSMWKENVEIISKDYDAAGFNWWERGEQHFSGTFWIARADWIRRLPNYVQYHHIKDRKRFSCELWIGAAQYCRAYSHGTKNAVTWIGNFDFTPHLPKIEIASVLPSSDSVTWVSGATISYLSDLNRLQQSFDQVGPGHELQTYVIPDRKQWRHSEKLTILGRALLSVVTSHVFWIDADCEFINQIPVQNLIDPSKPISAVKHFYFGSPIEAIPEHLRSLISDITPNYWQACVWGGKVDAVSRVLNRIAWIHADEKGYDEHALNIDFQNNLKDVNTLPCQYAMPDSFTRLPEGGRQKYDALATGLPMILHRNRESNR